MGHSSVRDSFADGQNFVEHRCRPSGRGDQGGRFMISPLKDRKKERKETAWHDMT